MRKEYSSQSINMKYVGTWIPPDVHVKLKQLCITEDRTLAWIIARELKNLAASVPDTPEPTP